MINEYKFSSTICINVCSFSHSYYASKLFSYYPPQAQNFFPFNESCYYFIFYFNLFIILFLGLHLLHMEVPRLGVKSELQLPAYVTATAMLDLSHICDLHHSSWQHWILSPLSKARDWTCVLMDNNQIHFCWATTGTSKINFKTRKLWRETF